MTTEQEPIVVVAIDDIVVDPDRFVALAESGTTVVISRDSEPIATMRTVVAKGPA